MTDGTAPGAALLTDGRATYTPGISESRAGGSRFYLPDARGTVHVALDGIFKDISTGYTVSSRRGAKTMAQIELAEETLMRAQQAATASQTTVEQWLADVVERTTTPPPDADPLLGLFADAPDLVDDILSEAMAAREITPWRGSREPGA